MVTPLGCGVETTWNRLIKGECGIRAISSDDLKMNAFDKETQSYTYDQLCSKIAATVPCGTNPHEFDEELWLHSKVRICESECSSFPNSTTKTVCSSY